MNPVYFGLFALVLAAVMALLASVVKKKRAGSEKYQQILANFEQQVNAMLEEGETVEAVCGYKPCAAVTDRRLLVGAKNGIDSVPYAQIKALKGLDGGANKTTNPDRMLVFEIKAAKKYTLGNHSDGFAKLVNSLYRHTGK